MFELITHIPTVKHIKLGYQSTRANHCRQKKMDK